MSDHLGISVIDKTEPLAFNLLVVFSARITIFALITHLNQSANEFDDTTKQYWRTR